MTACAHLSGGYDAAGSLLASVEMLDLRPVLQRGGDGDDHGRQASSHELLGMGTTERESREHAKPASATALLRWVSCGRMAHARDGFACGELPDGRVLVAGGTHYPFGVVEAGLRTAEIFDPSVLLEVMLPPPHRDAGDRGLYGDSAAPAAADSGSGSGSQEIGHAYGSYGSHSSGRSRYGQAQSTQRLARKAAREAAARAWKPLPAMTEGHGYAAGCVLADGRFLCCGGVDPEGVPSAVAEVYSPASNSWERIAPLLSPARDHKLCAVPGGVLLCVVGGMAPHLYDEESDTWHRLAGDGGTGDDKPVAKTRGHSTRFNPLLLTTLPL